VRERVRARSFLVGTGLLVVLILGAGFVSQLASTDGPGRSQVGVIGSESDQVASTVEAVADALGREVEVTFYERAAGRAALEEGDADVLVDASSAKALFADDVDDALLVVVQQSWVQMTVEARLAEAGLDEAEVAAALGVPPLEPERLDGGDDEPSGVGLLAGSMAAVLLFISLQTFGTYVLTGVVEEKSSAVVELLLVRAKAAHLLAGKIIGIGAAALAQFAAAVAAGMVSLAMSGVEVPPELWSALPMTLVWFIGGFALYSTLFALAGSLVSRQEDAQAAAAPIGYGLVAAYLLVFAFGYQPESLASRVLSLIPPFTPLLMPMRMAAGAASPAEIVAGVIGLGLATVLAVRVSGKIYEQVLLRRGSRIAWRDALALARGRSSG
jgi:ABC-2 type transport system permease protein